MMLRLALVGLVAALGITVPNEAERAHWQAAIEKWGTSALSRWDGWRDQTSIVDLKRPMTPPGECEQCRLARMRLLITRRAGDASTATRSTLSPDDAHRSPVAAQQTTARVSTITTHLVIADWTQTVRSIPAVTDRDTTAVVEPNRDAVKPVAARATSERPSATAASGNLRLELTNALGSHETFDLNQTFASADIAGLLANKPESRQIPTAPAGPATVLAASALPVATETTERFEIALSDLDPPSAYGEGLFDAIGERARRMGADRSSSGSASRAHSCERG